MARLKLLLLFLFTIILLQVVFADCNKDFETLNQFYESSKNKDFSKYISLMDTDYIYTYLADEEEYKTYVKSAWDLYDIVSFNLKLRKCNILPKGSLIFFDSKSILKFENERVEIERIYVAVFEQNKIQFVMDYETFSFHQNLAYYSQYFNEVKDIINQDLEVIDQITEYMEINDFSPKKKSGFFFSIIVFIFLIILSSLLFIKKNVSKKYFLGRFNITKKSLRKFAKKTQSSIKPKANKLAKHSSIAFNRVQVITKKQYSNIKPKLESTRNETIRLYKKHVPKYVKKVKKESVKVLKSTKKQVKKTISDLEPTIKKVKDKTSEIYNRHINGAKKK